MIVELEVLVVYRNWNQDTLPGATNVRRVPVAESRSHYFCRLLLVFSRLNHIESALLILVKHLHYQALERDSGIVDVMIHSSNLICL